jgi:hypothetical protein
MRARNIKPGFFKNADLAECSMAARNLAPGLWMLADREGRLEDRPKQIKGEIFPYDNVDVDELLKELERWNHIERYEVGGKKYIQVINFLDHQKPHIKEKQSVIPKRHILGEVKNLPSTDLGKNENALNPESLLLNPESSSTEEREKDFEEIWKIFPKQRRGNHSKAMASYRGALKRASHDEIMGGVRAYVGSEEVERGMAKGCAAWLNDDRWASEYRQSGNIGPPPVAAPQLVTRERYDQVKRLAETDPYRASYRKIMADYESQNNQPSH